jgi:hypothetical protein
MKARSVAEPKKRAPLIKRVVQKPDGRYLIYYERPPKKA